MRAVTCVATVLAPTATYSDRSNLYTPLGIPEQGPWSRLPATLGAVATRGIRSRDERSYADLQPPAGQGSTVCHRRRPGDARSVRAQTGDLCRLHGLWAGPDLHRGLHPSRGAPPLRQHPHRVQRHRSADHPTARGRTRNPVSYTHLTLPTILRVSISVVAAS